MLEFVCPNCNGNNLLQIEKDVIIVSDVMFNSTESDFELSNPVRQRRVVSHFSCKTCLAVVTDNEGEIITDGFVLTDWIRRNCRQEGHNAP